MYRGDVVIYDHPRLGACAGRVVAHGKDGCTLAVGAKGDKRHKAKWEAVRGHKSRAKAAYQYVDEGEDGIIVADDRGRRRLLRTGGDGAS